MDEQRPGRRHGVVLPVRTDPTGVAGPTRGQAARSWRRTSQGFYVPHHVEPRPAQRVAEASVIVPAGSAMTGWASLCWRGSRWEDGIGPGGLHRPVDIVGATRLRPQPSVRVLQERLEPGDVDLVDGLRVASAAHAVCFAMRHAASPAEAIEVLCMAYADDLVCPNEVQAWLDANPGRTGIAVAREAARQADENLWSPREVHLMLAWEDARGSRPLTNRPVFDLSGNHLGTPDLLDPVAGVAGEYEGAVHLERGQRHGDLGKEQRLRDAGLETFAVVADDMRDERRLRARIDAAYERARRSAVGQRWTLEQPDWWEPTHTVALRQALPGALREIWLPHLAAAARRRSVS